MHSPAEASHPMHDVLAMRLREETRTAHQGIDQHPLLLPLMQDTLTRPHYALVLQTLFWVHSPLQHAFTQALQQAGLEYELADRVGWLYSDLSHLGVTPTTAVPPWSAPVPTNAAELTGMLYVIEGSTLGGQVISRRLATSLSLGATNGARFFFGWGANTGNRWRMFWEFAATACPPAHHQSAIQAAKVLFASLHTAFDAALARQV